MITRARNALMIVGSLVLAAAAHADVVRCQRAIAKQAAKFVQTRAGLLSKCQGSLIANPDSDADCDEGSPVDQKVAARAHSLETAINKACKGIAPASIGWPQTCPNFEDGDCDNPIVDSTDISACLECIDAASGDEIIDLDYGDLNPTDPTDGDKTEKRLNKCQQAIGKAAATFLAAKSSALQKCWDSRLAGKPDPGCLAPGSQTQAAIATAKAKLNTTICKACGGADKACGGNDDFTPADIGFAETCLDVTVPGGAACGGPVATLQDLTTCVQCVTEFEAECTDRAQVPQFSSYPQECNLASCDDGEQDGNETDVDCGGSCTPCASGDGCIVDRDCLSGSCINGTCELPSTCEDLQQDGNETDVDCGGSCDPCDDGEHCATNTDCVSGICSDGLCQPSVRAVRKGRNARKSRERRISVAPRH